MRHGARKSTAVWGDLGAIWRGAGSACFWVAALALSLNTTVLLGQQGPPLMPRLLTVMPMGGQSGASVDLNFTGIDLDEVSELRFSSPGITAKPKLDAKGEALPNQFIVSIAKNAPHGIHEAYVITRYGISTSRAFVVGGLPEVTRSKPNTTPETAMELKVPSVCNAAATVAAVDHYAFQARKGQRILMDCAAPEIDSKLTRVIAVADAEGRDLLVNRRSGMLDFTAPADGRYLVKINNLTFEGGPEHFYRLTLSEGPRAEYVFPPVAAAASKLEVYGRRLGGAEDPQWKVENRAVERREIPAILPATRRLATTAAGSVLPLSAISADAFSWLLPDAQALPQYETLLSAETAPLTENEPNNDGAQAQKVTLPCDIAGQFYPAADVDTFEFSAKKGEVWWVEVISQRLGLRTDASVVVQQVVGDKLVDVAEMNDIANPVIGTAYFAGSADPMGRLDIKQDGLYRLQARDLLGGTRVDARNVYRLQVRKAQPDFALVAWPFHMPNIGADRSAAAKSLALFKGGTMAVQVAVIRKDGFNGPIEILADGLPSGITSGGNAVPEGKSQGFLFLTAAENAKTVAGTFRLLGRATIDGKNVEREGRMANNIWPVSDNVNEIPRSRFEAENRVSVSDEETAPIRITSAEPKVYEGTVGKPLSIPIKIDWGGQPIAALKIKVMGTGFETVKDLDVALKVDTATEVLDLAALKIPAGDYCVALYSVTRGRIPRYTTTVTKNLITQQNAIAEANAAAADTLKKAEAAKSAPADQKVAADKAAKDAIELQKRAESAKVVATTKLQESQTAAPNRDFFHIVVSEPIRISVKPAAPAAVVKK